MAKEEVLEVVNEETTNTENIEEELSPWYYFFSTGCGWCKKSGPIVEELNESGKYDEILMLDLSEPDNQALNKELQEEYGTRCGTPWFINADTGKTICGFREKDMVELWLKGEDVPEPPRPTGPPPQVPWHGSTNKENIAWKKEYNTWLKNNEHMGDDWVKRQKSASAIIDAPRPKSLAPQPPMGPALLQATEADLDKWVDDTKKWQEENKHMPNQQDPANMANQLRARRQQMLNQQGTQAPAPSAVDVSKLNTLDARIQALEVKLDKVLSHFGVK
tara:strand:+ start:50 stop:877 length:828 start_codon:yes stop_codon:yes gene_type:complete